MKTLLAGLFVVFAGCSQSDRIEEALKSTATPQVVTPPQAVPASIRMIIRTAALNLVVDNPAEFLSRTIAVVEAQGGYVADSKQWSQDGRLRASATLRIPAEKLTVALQEIKKGAIRVNNDSVSGQDVSDEYTDLGAQLTNLRATEGELRQLLTTVRERTQKASEILEVYNEISKVRGEIERLQGRVDFIKQMTAMSTINVELMPDVFGEPVVVSGFRPFAIATLAARSLIVTLQFFMGLTIWIVVLILPLILLFGLLAIGIKKMMRPVIQWRTRQSAPPQP